MIDHEGWAEDHGELHIRKDGSEVEFKTARIDLVIEKHLLGDYLNWLSEEKHALSIHPGYRSNSDKEKDKRDRFLDALQEALAVDSAEVDLGQHDLEGTKKELHPGPRYWFPMAYLIFHSPRSRALLQREVSMAIGQSFNPPHRYYKSQSQ